MGVFAHYIKFAGCKLLKWLDVPIRDFRSPGSF